MSIHGSRFYFILMKRITLSLILLIAAQEAVFCQYIQKRWFNKSDSVYGYYCVIPPASGRVQGAVVLLDGFSGNADRFLAETKIHNVAWNNDLLTVCIPTGPRYYLDSSMISLLNKTISKVMKEFDLRKDQFAIGGMSSGGNIAVRYAEFCLESPAQFSMQPQAVFAVDSPLDLISLYNSSQRDLQKNTGGWWLWEANTIVERFNTELGDPTKDITKYKKVSPLLQASKDSTNERSLRNTAVRTYHDVDVSWFIQNRNRSIYETNMLDGSEFISRLVRLGNKQAEFVTSKVPGRRSDGTRHPHSWNIVDEIDLVQWLKEKLHFYPEHIQETYSYTAPSDWAHELILFPMNFAPTINYKGFEELRFAPGWAKENSDEMWAYTLLWWLDKKYEINEKELERNLSAYYSGLTKMHAIETKLDITNYKPSKITVKKVATANGDLATYTATGNIFDSYVTKKMSNLNFKIHLKDSSDNDRTILLIEAAAADFSGAVWKKLDEINEKVKIKK